MFPIALDDPHPPIAALLRGRGMYTMAITDDGYSAMLQRNTGIERGFMVYREVDDLPEIMRNDAGTATAAIELISQAPRGGRFFLWVHFFGTHWPPESHPGVRVYGPDFIDQYDHEVAFFDSQVVRLLDALAGQADPTAVFITADHGEGLGAALREHGVNLDESIIRIPLIARVPGWPAVRVKPPVSLVDLAPTILALTRSPAPGYLEGVDLSEYLGKATVPPRVLFSDTWRFTGDGRTELDMAAAYNETGKVVLNHLSGNLYRIDDPGRSTASKLIGKRPIDNLSREVYGYIEETGGTLDLSD
jgi:hypothetical protein